MLVFYLNIKTYVVSGVALAPEFLQHHYALPEKFFSLSSSTNGTIKMTLYLARAAIARGRSASEQMLAVASVQTIVPQVINLINLEGVMGSTEELRNSLTFSFFFFFIVH